MRAWAALDRREDDPSTRSRCQDYRLITQMDELIQERVQAKQNELTAEYDERLRNYEDR